MTFKKDTFFLYWPQASINLCSQVVSNFHPLLSVETLHAQLNYIVGKKTEKAADTGN